MKDEEEEIIVPITEIKKDSKDEISMSIAITNGYFEVAWKLQSQM